MEMLIQLKMLTGVQFTSPTGIIGNYNHGKCVILTCHLRYKKHLKNSLSYIFLSYNVQRL